MTVLNQFLKSSRDLLRAWKLPSVPGFGRIGFRMLIASNSSLERPVRIGRRRKPSVRSISKENI